jgi:cell wall-associated NlpC family hydrolase
MPDDVQRSVALIEALLTDDGLRERYRADPARVLAEHGLASLSDRQRALLTLELRESRSSLAGASFAAAADALQATEAAVHAAPGWAHAAAQEISRLVHGSGARHPVRASSAQQALRVADVPALAPPSPPPSALPDSASSPTPSASSAPAALHPASSASPSVAGAEPERTRTGGAEHESLAPTPAQRHADAREAGSGAALLAHAGLEHRLAYPGDDASPRQLAHWMAAHAARAGLPPELPVMAALTESGLRDLSYGDRDSVGFFQMRIGIWNRGAYAGYEFHPALQLKWFIDQALAVRASHSGDPSFGRDPSRWGEWVAEVEQPAAIYRGRYQDQLTEAQAMLAGFALPAGPGPPSGAGEAALRVAERYLGSAYDWGGASPRTGFDCSGLVQFAFAQVGVHLPRVAAEQFHAGIVVARADLAPGDAVFFADAGGTVHHVGLYIGDGRFINAPATGEDVRIDSLEEPYFAAQYAGARRFAIADAGTRGYARTLPVLGG